MARTRPSIMSLGATRSAPAAAWETATRARSSTEASLRTCASPPSPHSVTPQWPWLVYSQRQTSVMTRRSGTCLLQRADGLLDHAVVGVGTGADLVFVWRGCRRGGSRGGPCRAGRRLLRAARRRASCETPGMETMGSRRGDLFADEEGQDQVGRAGAWSRGRVRAGRRRRAGGAGRRARLRSKWVVIGSAGKIRFARRVPQGSRPRRSTPLPR